MNIYTTATTTERLPHADALPTYDARDLTKDGVQAQIMLNNQTYFLRITRAGKLILTK